MGGGPRRAAVSAFGFGGINAHLLLESPEQAEALATRTQVSVPSVARKSEPIAIVGIGVHAGTLAGRRAFQEALLGGTPAGTEIDEVELPVGQFRIPPRRLGVSRRRTAAWAWPSAGR